MVLGGRVTDQTPQPVACGHPYFGVGGQVSPGFNPCAGMLGSQQWEGNQGPSLRTIRSSNGSENPIIYFTFSHPSLISGREIG